MPAMSTHSYAGALTSVQETVDPPMQSLHPNARLNGIVTALIGAGVLMFVGGIVEFFLTRKSSPFPWPALVPVCSLVGGALLAVWFVGMAILSYARFGYQLREKDLVIRSGVIWKTRRCVPRARIQHVDIDSGPIDRALGLVEVKLYVAGGLGAVAELPGLAPEAAEQLKEALIVARTDGV